MKKYLGLTLLSWTIYIILNSIMDSIIWHSGMFWYQNLVAWHWIKPFSILALFMTGWFAKKLYVMVRTKLIYMGGTGSLSVKTRKVRLRLILTIAFFIFYGCLWRFGLFEYLMDRFAGRL